LSGVRDREIWVEVRPEALEEHGVTFEQVGRVLQESNLDLPAGQLKARSGNIRVRTLGETGRAAELADMQVKSLPDGTALRFGELAAVRETFADNVERGRFMGKRAALVTVFKTPEEDAVRIAKAVKKYVKRPAPFGDAIELTATRDLSRFIRQRLDLMVRNAHLGLLLVILVLAVFLELRVALWVAVGLAVSFLGTFLAMMLLGETINLISMFGLIVVLGLLVDDAIVIGESVFTKRRQGLPPEQAAISGTNEVAAPVVTAIFTTMVAFLPMAFLDGRVGAFLRVLPIVVVCALSVSLFEAFVVLPTHLAHKFRPPRPGLLARVGALRQELLEHRLRALFSRVVNRALQWRYATLAGVVGFVLIAAGIVAGGHVPFILMGSTDAETLLVDLEMTPGTSEEETDATLRRIEAVLGEVEEIDSYFTVVGMTFQEGRRSNVADPATVGQITVEMKPADERAAAGLRRTQTVVNDLRRRSLHLPGVRGLTYQAQGGGPQGADIEVRLRSKDLPGVSRATSYVRGLIGSFQGVTEVYDDLVEGKLELRYSLLSEARSLGLTTRDLALQIRHALFGFEVQDLQEEDEEVTVRVLLPESERRRIEDLRRLRIATPSGGRVPLEEVAALETARGYSTLTRVDGQRAFTISAQVDEEQANVARLTAGLQRSLSDMGERFPGVTWSFEGSKEEMRESLSSLQFGFSVAALLIYALVAML
ncbi:MAG: efflux RND transporter permease subunit, partial [Planctomycetota bacterium]